MSIIDPRLPAQKLAALQKILESDFFNAVREVYEHVYETVDISGDAEVRASATAKVSSSYTQGYSGPDEVKKLLGKFCVDLMMLRSQYCKCHS